MAEIDILARLLDLGATGILAAVLWALWREYKEQNLFIRDLIEQAAAERRALAERLGMTDVEVKAEAHLVLMRWAKEAAKGDFSHE